MRNVILWCFLLFGSAVLFSQTGEGDSGFDYNGELARKVGIPNSPEAEAFAKYGETPVNMYIGKADIQIPLYEYEGKELSLPMTLTYDASGIRVEQEATQSGLGWNLNIGGRISRIVNGLPDGYLSSLPSAYTTILDADVRNKILQYVDNRVDFPTAAAAEDYFAFLKDINSNRIDTQPDYYNLSALGINDIIVFDVETMQPRTLNNPRIKVSAQISPTGNYITGWTVTNDDGTKFHFNSAEETFTDGNDTSSYGIVKTYYSSWMLTKIESPNRLDIYDFNYIDLGYWSQSKTSQRRRHAHNIFPDDGGVHSITYMNDQVDTSGEYKIKQQFLGSVEHNGNTIIEISLKDRCDLSIASAIDDITIFDMNSNEVNKYIFEHSYFGVNETEIACDEAQNEIRLKLDKLQQVSSLGNNYKHYSFSYISPELMPKKNSSSQDYLGYYNGKSNPVLYPKVVVNNITFEGADRSPDFNMAKIGLLNSITYPTGGYTAFEYEPHTSTYDTFDLNEAEEIENIYANVVLAGGNEGTDFSSAECYGIWCQDQYTLPPKVKHHVFTITEAGNYDVLYQRTGTTTSSGSAYIIKNSVLNPESPCDSPRDLDLMLDLTTGNPIRPIAVRGSYNGGFNGAVYLEEGCYQIIIIDGSSGSTSSVKVSRMEQQITGIVGEGEVERAGIRIKNIKSYTDVDELAFEKLYQYKTVINGSNSSGDVLFRPTLHYTTTGSVNVAYDWGDPCSVIFDTYLNRLTSDSGGERPHIAYSKVFEIQKNNGIADNGYIQHDFNTGDSGIFSVGGQYSTNFYYPNYEVGKESTTKVYSVDDTSLEEVNTTYNSQHYFSTVGFYTENILNRSNTMVVIYPERNEAGEILRYKYNHIPAQVVHLGTGSSCSWTPPVECSDPENTCLSINYSTLEGKMTLAQGKTGEIVEQQTKKMFESSTVSQTVNYSYYSDDNYYLPKETETTDSTNEVYKTIFYYPSDYDTSVYLDMINKNKLTNQIVVENYKNDQKLSSKKSDYTVIGTKHHVSEILTAKGDNALEPRIQFEYDTNGNVVEAKPVAEGLKTSYIWGYNNKYPIAKLEHVSYLDIPSTTIVNLKVLSNTDIGATSERLLFNALNDLRETFPNAMISTYTYNPSIGVTTMTDPRGYTTYYHYDEFNRLEKIKDAQGNILSENEYNYRTNE